MDRRSLFKPREIKKFKDLYEKHYGEKLDSQRAIIKLCLLVRMVELTSRPTTNEYEYGNENDTTRKRR